MVPQFSMLPLTFFHMLSAPGMAIINSDIVVQILLRGARLYFNPVRIFPAGVSALLGIHATLLTCLQSPRNLNPEQVQDQLPLSSVNL